jgi:hypothetical protein
MKTCWNNIQNICFDGKYFRLNGKIIFYKKSCLYCEDEFFSIGRYTKYCCQSHAELNKPFKTDIHKKRISESNKGKHKHKHTKETKLKMKKTHRGMHKEKLNNSWKGGVKKKNIPLYDTYAHQIEYAEQVRRNKEDSNILEVKCTYCGKWHIPKRTDIWSRVRSLNGKQGGEGRLYCSNECKQECPIYGKVKYSTEENNTKKYSREVQPELRQLVFKRDKYTCQKCGSKKSLHCHHIEGIRWEPLESADIDKCITYCKHCHKEVHGKDGCRTVDMQCKEI